MDETRAVARLPNLDIEITYRRLEDDRGEMLSVTLRAQPSFEAFARFAEARLPLWSALALGPWQAWMAMAQAALAMNPLLPRLPGNDDRR